MTELLRIYQDIAYDGVIGRVPWRICGPSTRPSPERRQPLGGVVDLSLRAMGYIGFHVGTNVGFCSILTILPRHDLGITVLCNGWYAQEAVWHGIADEIAKIFLDENQ